MQRRTGDINGREKSWILTGSLTEKIPDCLKYDFAVKRGMPEDVLPLWVADMDFETSSYIEDALIERAQAGHFWIQ